jgi:hypothetical protein
MIPPLGIVYGSIDEYYRFLCGARQKFDAAPVASAPALLYCMIH